MHLVCLFFCFAFYAEIQDGHLKWRENDFCEKSPVDWVVPLLVRVKKIVKISLSRSVSEINAFLCLTQKFKMTALFCEIMPVDSADTLPFKNFVSLCFRDKHVFAFYAEIQDGPQRWRENNFCEKSPADWIVRVKNVVKIALSHSVSEINSFLCLTQKFKMAAKSGGKTLFVK